MSNKLINTSLDPVGALAFKINLTNFPDRSIPEVSPRWTLNFHFRSLDLEQVIRHTGAWHTPDNAQSPLHMLCMG